MFRDDDGERVVELAAGRFGQGPFREPNARGSDDGAPGDRQPSGRSFAGFRTWGGSHRDDAIGCFVKHAGGEADLAAEYGGDPVLRVSKGDDVRELGGSRGR